MGRSKPTGRSGEVTSRSSSGTSDSNSKTLTPQEALLNRKKKPWYEKHRVVISLTCGVVFMAIGFGDLFSFLGPRSSRNAPTSADLEAVNARKRKSKSISESAEKGTADGSKDTIFDSTHDNASNSAELLAIEDYHFLEMKKEDGQNTQIEDDSKSNFERFIKQYFPSIQQYVNKKRKKIEQPPEGKKELEVVKKNVENGLKRVQEDIANKAEADPVRRHSDFPGLFSLDFEYHPIHIRWSISDSVCKKGNPSDPTRGMQHESHKEECASWFAYPGAFKEKLVRTLFTTTEMSQSSQYLDRHFPVMSVGVDNVVLSLANSELTREDAEQEGWFGYQAEIEDTAQPKPIVKFNTSRTVAYRGGAELEVGPSQYDDTQNMASLLMLPPSLIKNGWERRGGGAHRPLEALNRDENSESAEENEETAPIIALHDEINWSYIQWRQKFLGVLPDRNKDGQPLSAFDFGNPPPYANNVIDLVAFKEELRRVSLGQQVQYEVGCDNLAESYEFRFGDGKKDDKNDWGHHATNRGSRPHPEDEAVDAEGEIVEETGKGKYTVMQGKPVFFEPTAVAHKSGTKDHDDWRFEDAMLAHDPEKLATVVDPINIDFLTEKFKHFGKLVQIVFSDQKEDKPTHRDGQRKNNRVDSSDMRILKELKHAYSQYNLMRSEEDLSYRSNRVLDGKRGHNLKFYEYIGQRMTTRYRAAIRMGGAFAVELTLNMLRYFILSPVKTQQSLKIGSKHGRHYDITTALESDDGRSSEESGESVFGVSPEEIQFLTKDTTASESTKKDRATGDNPRDTKKDSASKNTHYANLLEANFRALGNGNAKHAAIYAFLESLDLINLQAEHEDNVSSKKDVSQTDAEITSSNFDYKDYLRQRSLKRAKHFAGFFSTTYWANYMLQLRLAKLGTDEENLKWTDANAHSFYKNAFTSMPRIDMKTFFWNLVIGPKTRQLLEEDTLSEDPKDLKSKARHDFDHSLSKKLRLKRVTMLKLAHIRATKVLAQMERNLGSNVNLGKKTKNRTVSLLRKSMGGVRCRLCVKQYTYNYQVSNMMKPAHAVAENYITKLITILTHLLEVIRAKIDIEYLKLSVIQFDENEESGDMPSDMQEDVKAQFDNLRMTIRNKLDKIDSTLTKSFRIYRKSTNFPPIKPRCSHSKNSIGFEQDWRCYCVVEGRAADYFTRVLRGSWYGAMSKKTPSGKDKLGDAKLDDESVSDASYLNLERRFIRASQFMRQELALFGPNKIGEL